MTRFGRYTLSPQDSSTDHGKWCQASQCLYTHALSGQEKITNIRTGNPCHLWTNLLTYTFFFKQYNIHLLLKNSKYLNEISLTKFGLYNRDAIQSYLS